MELCMLRIVLANRYVQLFSKWFNVILYEFFFYFSDTIHRHGSECDGSALDKMNVIKMIISSFVCVMCIPVWTIVIDSFAIFSLFSHVCSTHTSICVCVCVPFDYAKPMSNMAVSMCAVAMPCFHVNNWILYSAFIWLSDDVMWNSRSFVGVFSPATISSYNSMSFLYDAPSSKHYQRWVNKLRRHNNISGLSCGNQSETNNNLFWQIYIRQTVGRNEPTEANVCYRY